MEKIHITYVFNFNSPEEKRYKLYFDPETMELVDQEASAAGIEQVSPPSQLQEWTRLENNQCPNCPLKAEQSPHCPLARDLSRVTQHFANDKSYEKSKVMVLTEQRSYFKTAPLQEGLHSLFGLIMATSGCPHLAFLRPMARFHLPFSTAEETMVRSLSFFMVSEYFQKKEKGGSTCDLTILEERYEQVRIVNAHFVKRFKTITPGDASKNAVVMLDSFGTLLAMEISGDFSDLRKFF